jgi:hypothetical protein
MPVTHKPAVDVQERVVKSNQPTAKVAAATVGSAAGGALATVICSVLVTSGHTPPTGLEGAIATLCSAALAGFVGWLKRPDAHMRIISDKKGRPRIGHVKHHVVHRHARAHATHGHGLAAHGHGR